MKLLKQQVDNTTGVREIQVSGPWKSEYAKRIQQSGVEGIYLNSALGFEGDSLDFLRDVPALKQLKVVGMIGDCSGVEACRELEHLVMDVGGDPRIDYSTLLRLKSLFTHGLGQKRSVMNCFSLEDLYVYSFPDEDLTGLARLERLRKLQIGPARKLVSLNGIRELDELEMFGVYYAAKLKDIEDLGSLSFLRELDIENCIKISDISTISGLTGLQRLLLIDCMAIESLKPLGQCQKLEELLAYGNTNIVDGDLSVLGSVKNLRHVAMQDRRHYFGRPENLLNE